MSLQARMRGRMIAALLIFVGVALPMATPAASGTTIQGRILDTQGGLPVPNATVELDRGGEKAAETRTDADGTFAIPHLAPGTYVILIRANGYQNSRAPDLLVTPGEDTVSFQTAIPRAQQGLRQIGYVQVTGRTSLQTTTTINTHIDTDILTSQNFQRLGDVLTTVPGVITSTSSSVGDDMSLSIRGFDSTETATLLDGHPIGPIGAHGQGYNFNVSPFWGLNSVDVVFGSGATGLYGATTIAGAVNFQTINPTQQNHVSITQGVGNDDKLMTGFLGTGTLGKLGYAFAWGVQGTTGNFPGGYITQRALLQSSVVHPGVQWKAGPSPPPPDLTSANVNNTLNTYWVSGQYSQYNWVGKVNYAFSPRTTLQFTSYAANDWSNSTGEGDNDYQTYGYVLYGAQQTLATIESPVKDGGGGGKNTIYVNGHRRSCFDSIAVLADVPTGFECLNPSQYAADFYGPFGGSIDRWRTLGNQDYDARATQQLGLGNITLEGFADTYNYNEQKGPGVPMGIVDQYGPGPNYLYLFKNRGYVASDDIPNGKNDIGFGYSWLQQAESDGTFPYSTPNGSTLNIFAMGPQQNLATASYFVRDTWTPNLKFQAFGSIYEQKSIATNIWNFDPRGTFMYRPDPNDVFRFTGGRSYSEPDPFLINQVGPVIYGAASSINCPTSTTGTGAITSIANAANPDLKPETAEDLEVAYGHRFNLSTSIQAAAYQSWENGALLGGLVPISSIPQIIVPQSVINAAINRLSTCPGLHPTLANLAFSTTYNASGARYRGIVLSSNVGVMPHVSFNATYNIQSAAYVGVAQDILQANTSLLDGGQIQGVPLRQGSMGLAYQDQQGYAGRIDATYVGANNTYNRNPFWFADASVSKTTGQVTVGFGVHNLFDSAAQQYGYIGAGVYIPQNFYGLGQATGLTQGTEQYGLPFRQFWMTVKVGI